jgi:hypothetical protein
MNSLLLNQRSWKSGSIDLCRHYATGWVTEESELDFRHAKAIFSLLSLFWKAKGCLWDQFAICLCILINFLGLWDTLNFFRFLCRPCFIKEKQAISFSQNFLCLLCSTYTGSVAYPATCTLGSGGSVSVTSLRMRGAIPRLLYKPFLCGV